MKKPGTQHDVEHRVSWGSPLVKAGRVSQSEAGFEQRPKNEVVKTWQESAASPFAEGEVRLPSISVFSLSVLMGVPACSGA